MALAKIRPRGGTGAQWISANPILALREVAYETDTHFMKVGDGSTHYTSLPYVSVPGTSGGTITQVNGVNPDGSGHVTLTAANVGAVPTTRTVAGKALSANVTLVKTDVGLDQVDNTSDADKPPSDAVEAELGAKASTSHIHDDAYYPKTYTHGIHMWKTGDADPSWVGGTRPTGVVEWIVVDDEADIPTWKAAQDFVFITSVLATGPAIRSFGGFTAASADAGNTVCTYPAAGASTMVDGDELWLCVATTGGSTPSTPAGWTVQNAMLSSGASGSDGLIVFTRTLGAGEAATLGGTSVTVTLNTSTSAVATIVCWTGSVTINNSASGVDDANTNSAQVFPSVTPTATSTIVGISAVRYNAVAGGTSVNPRTGWTELFDRSTAKAGAPQRGLVFSVMDTAGANGVASGAASATTTQVVRTAQYTLAVT